MKKFLKIENLLSLESTRPSSLKLKFSVGLSLPELRLSVQLPPPTDKDHKVPLPKCGDEFTLIFEDEQIDFFIYQLDRHQGSSLEIIALLNQKHFLSKVEQKCYDDNTSSILSSFSIPVDVDFTTNDKMKYLRFNQIEKEFIRHLIYHMDSSVKALYYISQIGLVVRQLDKLIHKEVKEIGAYSSLTISSLPFNFASNQANAGFVEFLLDQDTYKNTIENSSRNYFVGDAGNTSENFYKNFYENYKNIIELYQQYVEVVVSTEVEMFDVIHLYNEDIKVLVLEVEYNVSNATIYESVNIKGVVVE